MPVSRKSRCRPPREQGMALFLSLAILLLTTLVGVAAVQATQLQARVARNAHDNLIAFQAAESALLEAERVLLSARPAATEFTAAGRDGRAQASGRRRQDDEAAAFWRRYLPEKHVLYCDTKDNFWRM